MGVNIPEAPLWEGERASGRPAVGLLEPTSPHALPSPLPPLATPPDPENLAPAMQPTINLLWRFFLMYRLVTV